MGKIRKRVLSDNLIERMEDLLIQATTEQSHYYVAAILTEAINEITRLRSEDQRYERWAGAIQKYEEWVHRHDHDWQCGCGHWNGCNLAFCACCKRRPNE